MLIYFPHELPILTAFHYSPITKNVSMLTLNQWQSYRQIQCVSGLRVALLVLRAERSRASLPRPNNTFREVSWAHYAVGGKMWWCRFFPVCKKKNILSRWIVRLSYRQYNVHFKITLCLISTLMSSRQRKGVAGGSVDNSIHHFHMWVGNKRINDAARNTRTGH